MVWDDGTAMATPAIPLVPLHNVCAAPLEVSPVGGVRRVVAENLYPPWNAPSRTRQLCGCISCVHARVRV